MVKYNITTGKTINIGNKNIFKKLIAITFISPYKI